MQTLDFPLIRCSIPKLEYLPINESANPIFPIKQAPPILVNCQTKVDTS